jgi:hypothetical protein
MASYDLKAILGEKLKRLTEKTLKALVDCMCTVGASLCSLDKRVSALESVELPEGGYKPMQEPVASPSASGTAIQFIDSISQDATGRMTATKKTVRTGSTSQTGVLQLTDSHTSTSTTTAATPKNVKEAYDLANSKQSPATTIAGYGITDAYTKTEVDTFLAVKAEQVNVTNYTSFSDIGAVVSAGNIPYYYHAVGSGAAKLYYQGTNVSGGIPPTVSQVFVGVFNGVLYETRFVNGASAFSAVVETPIFSTDRVANSGESSSWSSDDTNVPTRAAVESKISSAMSGNIGGFLGSWTPIGVQYYQTANDFKKGDWVSITEAGSVTYYKNNDRSQSYTTFAVNAGDDIYWTTSGEFQKKASTSLQIYPISNLEDWDSLTNTGLYQVASQASNVQNSPADGVTGISCLVSASGGKVLQMAQTNSTIFYRAYVTGNWSAWRDVKNADNATNAVNYMTNGQPYGIATRFFELQTAIGNTVYTWMLVNNSNNWVKYNSHTGAIYDTGTLQSSVHINEIVYAAGSTTELDLRIGIGSITDNEKFAMFPPFGYCGNDGSEEIRREWKRFVRYRITIYNTSDTATALYAVCGGRATATRAGYWRRGAVVVDYTDYPTPNTDPRYWEEGWVNKVQFATLLAHKYGTWEVWWYRDGPEDDPNFSSYDYMFITTIKAPGIL